MIFQGSNPTKDQSMANGYLFEYEPKRKLLTYDFSDKVFEQAKHELELEVEDNVGNKSIYKTIFFRKYNLN